MKKAIFLLLIIIFCFLFIPHSVYAACNPDAPTAGTVCTALGEIPTDQTKFVVWVLARVIGIGGAIAFLLLASGAFQILTSSGNPERVKKGTETITAAISGLLFIILSLFLLRLIGVEIFQIPGFG